MNTISSQHQRGTSLIEVLVSVTILVLGLLGLAQLQAKSLMMNQSAHYRSIAADLASDLADRIRANRTPFLSNDTADTTPALPPDFSTCVASTSTPVTFTCAQSGGRESYLVQAEMGEWYSALSQQLPNGTFTLSKVSASATNHLRYTLTITWLDDRNSSSNSNSSYSTVIE